MLFCSLNKKIIFCLTWALLALTARKKVATRRIAVSREEKRSESWMKQAERMTPDGEK
jgi:hypothetical protein